MPSKSRRNRRQRQGGGSGEGVEVAPRRERASRPKARSRRRSEASRGVYVVAGVAVAVVALVGFVLVQVSRGAGTASDFEFSVYQGEDILGGTNVNFGDLLDGGKPVVLNFWAGDCPPCRAEMPALQRVYDKHREDIIFVGLDVGIFSGLGTRASGLALLGRTRHHVPRGRATRPDSYGQLLGREHAHDSLLRCRRRHFPTVGRHYSRTSDERHRRGDAGRRVEARLPLRSRRLRR